MNTTSEQQEDNSLFLPNFCNVYTVFILIIVVELLAFILTLASLNYTSYNWKILQTQFMTQLAMTSWFMQWVSLLSQALLCVLRRGLMRLKRDYWVGIISYGLVLMITVILSELVWEMGKESVFFDSESWQHSLFLLRNLTISALISAMMLRYFYVQYQWRREIQARADMQIRALQARIHPHFLFNTMNTIASLVRVNPSMAEEVVIDFAELFRANLSEVKTLTTWEQEVTLSQQYLRIEALRLGERLKVTWKIEEIPKTALLPPLCLQPLLENAIYHGIQGLIEGGEIHIQGRLEAGMIHLEIDNPKSTQEHRGIGIAQDNLRRRLQGLWPQAYFEIQDEGAVYRVRLGFPVSEAESSE